MIERKSEMEFSFETSGEPDGLPVLLVHPLGGDRTFWRNCRRYFGPGLSTVSIDLPGSNDMPVREPVTLSLAIDHIEGLRRHLGYETVVLIGCAVGAMMAVAYAAHFPDHVAALILSNPGLRITGEAAENLEARARTVREHGMNALLPGAVDKAFDGWCGTKLHQRYTKHFAALDAEGYALSALGAAGADTSDLLEKIECPTLLVGGKRDRLFPPTSNAAEMAKRISASTLIEVPEGAHFIPYQRPRAFARLVREFLEANGLPVA